MFSPFVKFEMNMTQARGICYAWNATLSCQANIKGNTKNIFK